jgi:hypothetical protein
MDSGFVVTGRTWCNGTGDYSYGSILVHAAFGWPTASTLCNVPAVSGFDRINSDLYDYVVLLQPMCADYSVVAGRQAASGPGIVAIGLPYHGE